MLQGKGRLHARGQGPGAGRGAGPVRGWGQWEGECPGTSSYAFASASSRCRPGCLLPEVLLQILLPSPPPSARGCSGNPRPPRRERLWGGRSASAGCGVRALPWPNGPWCGSAGRGAITGCTPWKGDPEFFGKPRPRAGRGWSPSLRSPCLGFSGSPRGRGHAQLLRAFAES